jgi:hypothetical protein
MPNTLKVLYNLPWFGGVDVANSSKTIQTRVEYSRSTSSFVFIGSNQHDSAS